ncbi:hypothetical protein V6Z12_D13G076200 [Gossypium hirsutum]
MFDYQTRSVHLVSVEAKEILMSSKQSELENKIISAISAKKMIVQGADAYLVYIMDTLESKSEISQVSVVREFLDVFLEELIGLPPKREMEFSIELEPGATPISYTPYRMALLEFKELKE